MAVSARALAESARRAGLAALAVDLFGDEDTRAAAAATIVARDAGGLSFDAAEVPAILAGHAPSAAPIVLGAGFEDQPELFAELHRRFLIAGPPPQAVRRLKDPRALAGLLAELGVPHPRLAEGAPPPGMRLVEKRIGAAGGAHVRLADGPAPEGRYLQEQVAGTPLSLLLVADGAKMLPVGFSRQWTDPAPGAPFRYGGAVGPVAPPAPLAAALVEAARRIVAATGLVGLASLDALVDGETFHVLEVNPRPGATLDLFDQDAEAPLFGLHIAAWNGSGLGRAPRLPRIRAAAIVYADHDMAVPPAVAWPAFVADRPSAGTDIPAGAPIATLQAEAPDEAAARALLAARREALLALLEPGRRPWRAEIASPAP